MLGFDVVFAEADDSSGLKRLRQLAQKELRDQAGFAERLQPAAGPSLDYDAMFARALESGPSCWGITSPATATAAPPGCCRAPVMGKEALQGRPITFTSWNGFGSNIEQLANAAPVAGFFNPSPTRRCGPLAAADRRIQGPVLRVAVAGHVPHAGRPADGGAGFPRERFLSRSYQGLESILLKLGAKDPGHPGRRPGRHAGAVSRFRRRQRGLVPVRVGRRSCCQGASRPGP
jgi:adenylate cyclase